MSKRVYVAASSKELERAENAIQALLDLGHSVAHDWPAMIRRVGSANPADASPELNAQWANEDLAELESSEVLWLLMPAEGGFGAAVELGFALGKEDMHIVVSGPAVRRSIFTSLACAEYATDAEALEAEFASEAGLV